MEQPKGYLSYLEKLDKEDSFLRLQAYNTGNLILVNSPGMRILKTCLSILLCLTVDYIRQASNFYDASIATIVTLRQDTKRTWKAGFFRVLGTFAAGIYASCFVTILSNYTNLERYSLPYLLLVGLFVIPLMQVLVLLKQKDTVTIATIVFLLICVSDSANKQPVVYAMTRVLNNIIGVIIALFINWFPPLNKMGDRYDKHRQRAYINADLIQVRLGELEEELAKKEEILRANANKGQGTGSSSGINKGKGE
ncbi:FUSC family protein [Kallipyga gabonensis]|uniref:FUSC family protein n=1 Tax=Kallipyga gabonensis TaxID=1686287 RepID=UPI0006B45589|nr:aromatic acid exporter family protein [Kallipyga gabonensis]